MACWWGNTSQLPHLSVPSGCLSCLRVKILSGQTDSKHQVCVSGGALRPLLCELSRRKNLIEVVTHQSASGGVGVRLFVWNWQFKGSPSGVSAHASDIYKALSLSLCIFVSMWVFHSRHTWGQHCYWGVRGETVSVRVCLVYVCVLRDALQVWPAVTMVRTSSWVQQV